MNNEFQKFHLYMDESGSFEGSEKKAKKENCLLFAMLVPDLGYDAVMQELRELQTECGYSGFIHAKEIFRDTRFPEYLSRLIEFTTQKKIILAVLRYQADIYNNLGNTLQEIFAANRYLSMAQTMFEHLFFLAPEFYHKNMDILLHPNSRIIVVDKCNKEGLQQIKSLGYRKQEITSLKKESSGSKTKPSKCLVFTWTSEIVATSIHRMAVEYSPWQNLIGKRNFSAIETIVAKNTTNPFVHAVDHLAWLSLSETYRNRFNEISVDLSKKTAINLAYGPEQSEYRNMMRLFLNNDMEGFLSHAKERITTFKNPYYRSSILKQIEKSLTKPSHLDLKQMETLEHLADNCLRNSEGSWDFVLYLISRLISLTNSMPAEQRMTQNVQRLLFKLYSHKLSVHNHRGEDADAADTYGKIKQLHLGQLSISDYRENIALENRIGVTFANIFAFHEGIETITPHISAMEQSLALLQESAGEPLTDPLIGKLRGSLAQCYGFLAPRNHELFPKAEELFRNAANQFPKENDKLRHNINLLHLYLDWQKSEESSSMAERIRQTPSVARFFDTPSPETAKYCQFALTVLIKYGLVKKQTDPELIEKFSLHSLRDWFGESVNEHPFELLYAYLGRIALQVGNLKIAKDYFSQALTLPPTENLRKQTTLQTIRAEIYTWWALELFALGQTKPAQEKMRAALSIMQEIGRTVGLETILSLQSKTPSGWFSQGWTALAATDWQTSFNTDACEQFLKCFTFNYY
jgi:tetratricopeptide (TPR) repeat protein